MNDTLNLRFLGAAGTVTGSRYLVEIFGKRLLVDCGLFQGLKELRLKNREPFPLDVRTIDAVILTHGHLDHVGYLPLLVRQGFSGPVYATAPTVDITKLILLDSARIQEEDAEHANRYAYSRHHPAEPLYTVKDAERVFPLLQPVEPGEWQELFPEVSFRFRYNGHIIGAAFVELKVGNKTLVFSGDIGRPEDPVLFPPEYPEHADILLIESTYGGKRHKDDPKALLANAVRGAAQRKGTILIPGFAVERAQLLMYYLHELLQEKAIPELPVYMDSPMAAHVLDVFKRHRHWHKLSGDAFEKILRDVRVVRKPEETQALLEDRAPKIIIAASGMATGGRILSYFERYLGDPRTTVLLAGHQGEGTRGRALLDGAQEIRIHGKFWKVRAHIGIIEGLSAHADQDELIDWMSRLKERPRKVFIVHGEPQAANALKDKIQEVYRLHASIPGMGEKATFGM